MTTRRLRRSKLARARRASVPGDGRRRAASSGPGIGSRIAGAALFVLACVVVSVLFAAMVDGELEPALVPLSVMVVFGAIATPKAIGLWRGTRSHTTITPTASGLPMSDDGQRAFTPCAVVSADGMTLAYATLVVDAPDLVGRLLFLVGVTIFVAFFLLGLCVAYVRRPRVLLPKTMRS